MRKELTRIIESRDEENVPFCSCTQEWQSEGQKRKWKENWAVVLQKPV
jgi:hypothetical protein